MSFLETIAQESLASQDSFEFAQLLKIVATIDPQVIVEIGVDKGYSMQAFNTAFLPKVILGIDIASENMTEDNEHLHAAVIKQDSTTGRALESLMERLGGKKIDFLFIDGDHRIDAVRKDFNNYHHLVRPGGIIAFHDIMRVGEQWKYKVEVREFFDELKMQYPSIELWNGCIGENAPGIGIIFV